MDAERWRNLERLYHAALERKPEERGMYVAEMCQGDEELRRELESLLRQDVAANSPLDRPAWEDAASLLEEVGTLRLEPGMQVGPYRIGSPIGAGGMGRVYKAHDSRLGRDVAIKVLREDVTQNSRRRSRLEIEARAVAALNHPHICTLHDVGPNYLVMEYIEGESLAARIRKGPIPIDQALRIAIESASALEAAHRHGIIHRDLKPGNIMLTDSGTKLLDFGLAKFQDVRVTGEGSMAMTNTDSEHLFGTLSYMSPEQLEGEHADARSDIFSFGAVLYEMVAGKRAFDRNSTGGIVNAICREQPRPLRDFLPNVPHDLQRIIYRCLRKAREERYASASDILRELEECRSLASEPVSGINFKVLFRQSRRPRVAIPGLLIILLLGSLLGWWIERSLKARWARTEAIPKISRLIEQEKLGEAYALAVEAEKYISGDPVLDKLWPKISYAASVRTVPSGATVFRRNFSSQNNAWESLGRSPIENYRLPLMDSQWRLELAGFAPVERSTFLSFGIIRPSESISVKMDKATSAPPGMIHQTNGVGNRSVGSLDATPISLFGLTGFEDAPEILLKDYWIDRYEVTNKQFKAFLDNGGYSKPEFWKQPFNKDGRNLSWHEAMDMFRDTTGRPGPATWALSDYPRGQDDFPVSGVSWYEAAAYAEFARKALPTIYHWATAASPMASASILTVSNFGTQGPARVGSFRGMSWFGAYDMAGNVKEWCWNEAGSGKRYILGGAWDEPLYMFNNADARSPFERSPDFGFRCAKYVSTGSPANAAEPLSLRVRDFNREKPVLDDLFRVYKSLYSYDKTPLHAIVESAEQTEEWKREKISFAAAYGNERVIAYLFLPKKSKPPFQIVAYFPGSAVIDLRSSATFPDMIFFDFLIKSGRAVMFPVYKGTLERGDDLKSDLPNTSSLWRDHVIAWSKDLGRSIDYLETRPEIDAGKLAYYGVSWGGVMGSVFPALEDRIKVCVLVDSGFNLQKSLPEVDQLNFAPRVKVPVLMLNGRFDYGYPPEISQVPMFRLLGTSKQNKRRVVYETGHNIPRNELIKETLNWLDHYLGPVN